MKIIGLTGGIGTGKSTVSAYLSEKGIPIIDADQIARDITAVGSKTLEAITEAFGDGVLTENGELDRRALAETAFSSEEKKMLLEQITHRAIREEIDRRLREAALEKEKLVVLDAPLLIESGTYLICDTVWVVCADRDVRMKRIAVRDGLSEEQILARMRYQLQDEKRNLYANVLLDNSGERSALYRQVEQLLGQIDE